MKKFRVFTATAALLCFATSAVTTASAENGEVNVYTYRETKLIQPLFPNAGDRGSHVNISGVALTKHAPNKANAVKLMEFLASEDAQKIYATANNEYPVNPQVMPSDIVQSWGKLKPDPLPLENIAKFRKKASELVDKVNFDAGPSS